MNIEELRLFLFQALNSGDNTMIAKVEVDATGRVIIVDMRNGKAFEIQIEEVAP